MTFAAQITAALAPVASSFPSSDVTQAAAWAQSIVESYCNRTFDEVADDVVLVDPYIGKALLPGTPISAISSVQGYLPDPTTGSMSWQTLTNYMYTADTGLIYDTTGLPGTTWNGCYSWPWLPESLKVTYTHGYSTVPAALVNVAVRLAQQYCDNPTQVVQYRVGSVETRYSGSAGMAVSEMDRAILDRFAVVTIA